MPSSGTTGGQSSGVAAFSSEVRERLLSGHPIRGGEYTLPTPMMQRTYALVRELVWARRTGPTPLTPKRSLKRKRFVFIAWTTIRP